MSAAPQTAQAGGAPAIAPDRLDPGIKNVRRHTARGTVVNSGFQVGLAALGLIQRLVAAAFLTRSDFGLWAIILTALVGLSWLKQFGIADKYIQQSEPDQELAFQKAFTLEALASLFFFAITLGAIPLYSLAYGHPEMIVPAIVCALSVPISAFETPAWIPYRQMKYVRQRVLTSVDPVVSFMVVVALAVAGAGYWCFVIGIVAGSVAGAVVCTVSCPYRLRFRYSRQTVREYASFSLPLFGGGVSRLIVVQGSLLAANRSAGLAGIGAIGLATGIATFADRVDAIVSQTIYPAVCAVADRVHLLAEVFTKSNRVALMWAMPFGVGLALFAHDIINFFFGQRWATAAPVLAVMGLVCAFRQVAFNWTVFMRATNNTRPLFIGTLADMAAFATFSLPAILLWGVNGWAAGLVVGMIVQFGVRTFYLSRLFPGFNIMGQLWRAVAPVAPGAILILGYRAAVPGDRTLELAIAELVVFAGITIACTWSFERRLLRELSGYLLSRAVRS